MNLTIINKGLPKKQPEKCYEELYNNIGGVLEKTYQRVDALLRPKFKNKKFCNCCGKCCKSMAIPIMPVEAINITIRLMENESFYERCKNYYLSQLSGGIKKAIVCPYQLDDGKCGIYDIRPLICRTWLSTKENCLGEATTEGAIFDVSKIKSYYSETLKDLSQYIFDVYNDVKKINIAIDDTIAIQMPLLDILSYKTGKGYEIKYTPNDDNKVATSLSKDLVRLCEYLSGKTYLSTDANGNTIAIAA